MTGRWGKERTPRFKVIIRESKGTGGGRAYVEKTLA